MDLPKPEKLRSHVFVYDRTIQRPGDMERGQFPHFIWSAVGYSGQIREVRFKQVPDPHNKKEIDITGYRAETRTTPRVFDLFYGFHFPIPVFDVTVWLESLSGTKKILLICEERVKSVTFPKGIVTVVPYFKVHISYSADLNTYKAFDIASINLLQIMSMPALEYGIFEKPVSDEFLEKYSEKIGVWEIETVVQMSNEKTYSPIPIKVDMDGLCAE